LARYSPYLPKKRHPETRVNLNKIFSAHLLFLPTRPISVESISFFINFSAEFGGFMFKKSCLILCLAILAGCASNLQKAAQISKLNDFNAYGQPKKETKVNWEGSPLQGNIKSIEGKMYRLDPEGVIPDYICASYIHTWDSLGHTLYFVGKDSLGKEIVKAQNTYSSDGKILRSTKASNTKDSSFEETRFSYDTPKFKEIVDYYQKGERTFSIGFQFNEKGKATQVKILYPNNRTYFYTYDSNDSILQIKNKEGSGLRYKYDPFGNMTEYSSRFLLHTYIYKAQDFDSLGRKTATSYFNEINQTGTTTEYFYGNSNKHPSKIHQRNKTFKISYENECPKRVEELDSKGKAKVVQDFKTDSMGNIILSIHKTYNKKHKDLRPALRYEYTIEYWGKAD